MATDPALWRPSVASVAAIVAQRPGDATGTAQTSFTATTVPSATQVATIIGQVQGEIIAETGDMPAALAAVPVAGDDISASPAGRVVALGAAAYVELQFFPDLQTFSESVSSQLWDRYVAAKAALVAAVADLRAGEVIGDDEAQALLPAWSFPATGTSSWEPF